MLSWSVLRILSSAITPSTRASYDHAQRTYRVWVANQGSDPPLPITVPRLLAWLTELADVGVKGKTLSARTIAVYRSAISTMHEESEYGWGANPASNTQVTRLMKGITKLRRKEEGIKRSELPVEGTIDLTPAILIEMEPFAGFSDDPADMSMWAAACVGVFGLLRLNELLGTRANPDRILKVHQITFYREGSKFPARLPPEGPAAPPHMFTITFGATKADQAAKNKPHPIAAPMAVHALWRWMILRQQLQAFRVRLGYQPDPNLFNEPDVDPLSLPTLVKFLQDWMEAMGHGRPHLTGKAFRRGGASGLVAAGVPRNTVAAAGRWRTPAMVETYASEQAQAQAQILESSRVGRP